MNNSAPQTIDDLLDQVALLIMEEDNQGAKALLPKILAEGDDVQRQMAESYQMQIDLMLEMQAQEIDEGGFFATEDAQKPSEIVDESQLILAHDTDRSDPLISVAAPADHQHNIEPSVEAQAKSEPLDAKEWQQDEKESKIDLDNQSHAVDVAELFIEQTGEAESEIVEDSQSVLAQEAEPLLKNVFVPHAVEVQEESPIFDAKNEEASERDSQINSPLMSEAENRSDHVDMEAASPHEAVQEEYKTVQETAPSEHNIDALLSRVATLLREEQFDESLQMLQKVLSKGSSLQRRFAERYLLRITQQMLEQKRTLHNNLAIDQQTHVLAAQVSVNDDMPKQSELAVELEDHSALLASTEGLLSPMSALKLDYSLHDAAQSLHKEKQSQTHSQKERQGFMVGNIGLMIDFADGSELTEIPAIYRVPNAPKWLLGLINLHGRIIPVFDLGTFLGFAAPQQGKKQKLLVLAHNERSLGVLVDGLPKRLSWHEEQKVADNTAPAKLREHISASCWVNDKLWFDLNTVSLSHALERSL